MSWYREERISTGSLASSIQISCQNKCFGNLQKYRKVLFKYIVREREREREGERERMRGREWGERERGVREWRRERERKREGGRRERETDRQRKTERNSYIQYILIAFSLDMTVK